MTRPVFYVAHQVSGDVHANVSRAIEWLGWLMRTVPDVAFIMPWASALAAGEDDTDPAQRARGLLDCQATVARCDGIVLCGARVSSGMALEREAIEHQAPSFPRFGGRTGPVIIDLTVYGTTLPAPKHAAILLRAVGGGR